MSIDILNEKGRPLDQQLFTWRDLVQTPVSKLDDDAFTKVRIILMNGIEIEANRFQHSFARMSREMQSALAQVRRIEQHQQTLVNWLLPSDMSPIETTIAYEQAAIEVTASVVQAEPDPYLAQTYRFGLLEDLDHLYRYSALMDRVYGKDPNMILQSYTDVVPGRPTVMEHRHPEDDLRNSYDRTSANPLTKLHALTMMAGEQQTHNYYMNIGPTFSDPVARQLYAEIASIEEQHITQYESIIDTTETWLEKWLLHEATEVYNYYGCVESETNSRIKAIWERFLDYELGQFHFVSELFKKIEDRDPAEIISEKLPKPISFQSQRELIRTVLSQEVDLRASGPDFVPKKEEPILSKDFREQLNSQGSPSELIAAGYRWHPGGELARLESETQKDVVKATVDRLKGDHSEVLIDKLGERLAFERMGTCLYEQLIQKCQNDTAASEIVSVSTLEQFRNEEAKHFRLLQKIMHELGADPTSATPGADAMGVATSGILEVMTEPRTSVSQSLQALLSAEATDSIGWELLTELCEELSLHDYIQDFERALEQEARHLEQIQEYLRRLTFRDIHIT